MRLIRRAFSTANRASRWEQIYKIPFQLENEHGRRGNQGGNQFAGVISCNNINCNKNIKKWLGLIRRLIISAYIHHVKVAQLAVRLAKREQSKRSTLRNLPSFLRYLSFTCYLPKYFSKLNTFTSLSGQQRIQLAKLGFGCTMLVFIYTRCLRTTSTFEGFTWD